MSKKGKKSKNKNKGGHGQKATPRNIPLKRPGAPASDSALSDILASKFSGESVQLDGKLGVIYTAKPSDTDDLTEISGIGPVNENALNELGVYRFKQIANWSQKHVDEYSEALSFTGRIEREEWVLQAQRLAAREEAEAADEDEAELDQPPVSSYASVLNKFAGEAVEVDPELGVVYTRKADHIDDLTRISGVGQVISGKLNEIGVYCFRQIAEWNDYNVREFNKRLAFSGRIQREEWINQSKKLTAECAVVAAEAADDAPTQMGDTSVAAIAAGLGVAGGAAAVAASDGESKKIDPADMPTMRPAKLVGDEADAETSTDDDDDFDDLTEIHTEPSTAIPAKPKSETSRVDVPTADSDDEEEDPSDAKTEIHTAASTAIPAVAKSDTSRIDMPDAKSTTAQIPVEDNIFKSTTIPMEDVLPGTPGDMKSNTSRIDLPDDKTTEIQDETSQIGIGALASPKSDTSKINIEEETTQIAEDTSDLTSDLSDDLEATLPPAGSDELGKDAAIFKSTTMPIGDLDENTSLTAGDTGLSLDDPIFKSTTMPVDIDAAMGDTSDLQHSDTTPMSEDENSEAEAGIGIVPVAGVPDAAKSTTMPIDSDAANAPAPASASKAKMKPAQLRPKTVKKAGPVSNTPSTAQGLVSGGAADQPRTVKLKRPGSPSAPASASDAPKTVKLKKAPSKSSAGSSAPKTLKREAVKPTSDPGSTMKTVKLQRRPGPTGGPGGEGEGGDDKKKSKKSSGRRKRGAKWSPIWLILSIFTFLIAAGAVWVQYETAYPEGDKLLKGLNVGIPFPKPKGQIDAKTVTYDGKRMTPNRDNAPLDAVPAPAAVPPADAGATNAPADPAAPPAN